MYKHDLIGTWDEDGKTVVMLVAENVTAEEAVAEIMERGMIDDAQAIWEELKWTDPGYTVDLDAWDAGQWWLVAKEA